MYDTTNALFVKKLINELKNISVFRTFNKKVRKTLHRILNNAPKIENCYIK